MRLGKKMSIDAPMTVYFCRESTHDDYPIHDSKTYNGLFKQHTIIHARVDVA